MMDINKRDFGGRQVVTCNTCHNGRPVPADMPVFPVLEPKEPVKPVLPPVDQILTRYVQALGGEQAIRKVTSRVITGTQYIPTGPGGTVPMPAMVERYQKAPGVSVTIYRTPTYAIAQGFDGTTAWAQDQAGRVSDAVTLDTRRAKRTADFYEPLTLKQQYAQITVKGIEKVHDHDAYVVVGVPQGDSSEWLYFDTQSGLLLRKVTVLPTPAGNSPFQTDFDDYRDTGSGVKFPFLIQMNPATPRTELAPNATLRVTKVQDNAPIEDWPLNGQALQVHQREGRGDRHMLVVDPTNRMLYEFYQTRKTSSGWTAAQASIFDLKTNKMRPEEWASSDAAGLRTPPMTWLLLGHVALATAAASAAQLAALAR